MIHELYDSYQQKIDDLSLDEWVVQLSKFDGWMVDKALRRAVSTYIYVPRLPQILSMIQEIRDSVTRKNSTSQEAYDKRTQELKDENLGRKRSGFLSAYENQYLAALREHDWEEIKRLRTIMAAEELAYDMRNSSYK